MSVTTQSDVVGFDPYLVLPVAIGRWLDVAEDLVIDATIGTVYDVDAVTGFPKDTQLAAVKRAVCAQISAWIKGGVDPLGGAGESSGEGITAATLQGIGSVTYGSVTVDERLQVAADQLSSEPWRILRRAGLIRPVVFG